MNHALSCLIWTMFLIKEKCSNLVNCLSSYNLFGTKKTKNSLKERLKIITRTRLTRQRRKNNTYWSSIMPLINSSLVNSHWVLHLNFHTRSRVSNEVGCIFRSWSKRSTPSARIRSACSESERYDDTIASGTLTNWPRFS